MMRTIHYECRTVMQPQNYTEKIFIRLKTPRCFEAADLGPEHRSGPTRTETESGCQSLANEKIIRERQRFKFSGFVWGT